MSVRAEMKDRSMSESNVYMAVDHVQPAGPMECSPGPARSVAVSVNGALVRYTLPLLALLAVLTALSVLLVPVSLRAQEPPPLWLIATGDTILVQIPRPPLINYGFVVDRIGPDGEVRLTEEPVFPVRSPGLAASLLGEDLPLVLELLETTDEVQLLRRLQADAFTAGVSSILFRNVAFVLGRLYADTTALPGASYEYRVTFLDEVGEETTNVISSRVTMAERLPTTPGALAGSAGNGEVLINWRYDSPYPDAEDFVLGFQIERAVGSGDFRAINEVPHLRTEREVQEFVDHDLHNGLSYQYRVRAVDLAGRLSQPSGIVVVEPFDDRAPAAPQNLVTEPGEGRVRLVWRVSPEATLAGYLIERSMGLDQPFIRLTEEPVPAMSPSWVDQTARGGVQYFYRVIAVNERGMESRPSNPISAVPYDRTPPEPPEGLEATVVERKIEIRWSASVSDDIRGYHIYRGEVGGPAIRLTERPLEGLDYLDHGFDGQGLEPGGHYMVRVAAVDHSSNESASIETTVQVPDDVPPAAPTALQLRNVEGRLIEISWSAGGSLDVESYRLTRTTMGPAEASERVEIGLVPASGRLRLRDEAVRTGAEYRYHLVAIDSAGNLSEPTEASLHFRRLAAPPSTRRVGARVVEGGVLVRWERVIDDELVGYHIYRATIPTGVYELVSELIPVGQPLEFIDREGQNEHYYQVRAVDRSGNESRPSPAVTAGDE